MDKKYTITAEMAILKMIYLLKGKKLWIRISFRRICHSINLRSTVESKQENS